MKVADSFSLTHLDDIVRNALSLSHEVKLEYVLNKCDDNESTKVLGVRVQGVYRDYVLVKVVPDLEQNETNSSVLQPVFVVKSNFKESYGAFDKGRLVNFAPSERNKLSHLQLILKTLAQFQAKILASRENNEIRKEYALNDTADKILDYFKSVDRAKITETLEKLQVDFNKLLKSKVLVKSIWSSANNVYVSLNGTESLFLDTSAQQFFPPAYDALLYIFSLSDERFRQIHFEDLATFYFKSLAEALELENSNLQEEITRSYAEVQLKTLLPITKMKFASELTKSNSAVPQFEEIIGNLLNYFKYPLMQQEDVHETIKHKLSSTDYSLLDYKLVPLTESNGHLGEYFHLGISLIVGDTEQTLNLFAKFLMGSTEMLRDVLETGVGATEDFFYTTLYKLFQNHDLENMLTFAPKCYLSKLSGFLVLDDLGRLGYKALKPNATLNKDGIQVVLAQVAKLHASSIIFEEILSKQTGTAFRLGDEYSKFINEKTFNYGSHLQSFFDGALQALYWAIEKFPEFTEDLGLSPEELRGKLKDLLFSSFSRVKKSESTRNVLNHGDLYVANMLLKFGHNGNDETIEDAVLIDFQSLRYLPPAYEVLFFIYLTSSKETRDQHLTELLDWYYECFSTHLKNFNLDVETVYSRKHFSDDINYAKPGSLGAAFNYGYLTHLEPDFREEIMHDQEKSDYYFRGHTAELMELSWEKEHFRRIIRGFVQDFCNLIKNGF